MRTAPINAVYGAAAVSQHRHPTLKRYLQEWLWTVTKKMKVIPLPSCAQQTGAQRIIEQRGELAILHPSGPVYNPVYLDIHPGDGNTRGQHYHKSKTETFYVISGHCRISYFDLDTGEKGSIEARAGDMVTIMPRCAHKMEAVQFCQVIEFSIEEVDYPADTVPYEIE